MLKTEIILGQDVVVSVNGRTRGIATIIDLCGEATFVRVRFADGLVQLALPKNLKLPLAPPISSKPSGTPLDLSGIVPLVQGLKIDIRLYWQDHFDDFAQEWASEHGVPVDGCVPNIFGKHGGTTPQWSISGTVTIEMPQDGRCAKIMQELSGGDSEPQIVNGNIVVNGYHLAAGMAKACPWVIAHS